MAWTTPLTAVANAALTAAQWNASVRDNLLETAPAKATSSGTFFAGTGVSSIAERVPVAAFETASETTTSTSYDNLATVGPAVTTTSGARSLVSICATVANSTVNASSDMGIDVSGAHTLAAGSNLSLRHTSATANAMVAASYVSLFSVAAGTSTYTAKYRVSSGTGTFDDRRIAVIPF